MGNKEKDINKINELSDDTTSDNSINESGSIENEPIDYKTEEELIYTKYKLSMFEKVLLSIKLLNPLYNYNDVHTELHNTYKTSNQYSEEYIKQTMCRPKVKGALKDLMELYTTEQHKEKYNQIKDLIDDEMINQIKEKKLTIDNLITVFKHTTQSDIKKVSESTITKVSEKPKIKSN